jgi:hypothetical protein
MVPVVKLPLGGVGRRKAPDDRSHFSSGSSGQRFGLREGQALNPVPKRTINQTHPLTPSKSYHKNRQMAVLRPPKTYGSTGPFSKQ